MKYIIIFQQVIGSSRNFETAFEWDGEFFDDKKIAISHGFETRGSDDFNIGEVVNGKLTGFYWMDEELTDFDLEEIAEAIDL